MFHNFSDESACVLDARYKAVHLVILTIAADIVAHFKTLCLPEIARPFCSFRTLFHKPKLSYRPSLSNYQASVLTTALATNMNGGNDQNESHARRPPPLQGGRGR
jgi:hypothetical protein